jgi:hypothetical protein
MSCVKLLQCRTDNYLTTTKEQVFYTNEQCIAYWSESVTKDGEKRREVKEIKPQEDMRFNVENPPNTRGKNHGRHYDRSPVTNANGGGLQEVEWIDL